MRRAFTHLARAALVGFSALFLLGAVMIAEDQERSRERYEQRVVERARAAGEQPPPEGSDRTRAAAELYAREKLPDLFAMGLLGAVFAVAATLLLWFLFPVGPASKIVFGALMGPLLPALVFSGPMLKQGKGGDLGGIVVFGVAIGALAGLLEANRVLAERREAPGPDVGE